MTGNAFSAFQRSGFTWYNSYSRAMRSREQRVSAMERMTVAEAERDFGKLVNRVYTEGISIELERGDKIIARLTPGTPQSPLRVRDLNAFLQSLPRLGDDAEAFANEVRAIRRQFPAEGNPW